LGLGVRLVSMYYGARKCMGEGSADRLVESVQGLGFMVYDESYRFKGVGFIV